MRTLTEILADMELAMDLLKRTAGQPENGTMAKEANGWIRRLTVELDNLQTKEVGK